MWPQTALLLIPFLLCIIQESVSLLAPELFVTLADGSPVMGVYKTANSGRGIRAFRNIPYGEPPVGDLRFAPSIPRKPWTEAPRNGDEFIICPQRELFLHGGKYMGDEDCLFLNVYVPLTPKAKDPLPVMLYIYGGGYFTGFGNEVFYGPDYLLEKDVILIVGNYRLHALGFLSTLSEEFPGNYGLKDQLLMLQWIHDNIHKFGGDPRRVTLVGQSAGAASVGYHLFSPISRKYFQRAIMQSGTPLDNWAHYAQETARNYAHILFNISGCPYSDGDYKETLVCMRSKTAQEITESLKAFSTLEVYPVVVFAPVVEEKHKTALITEEDFRSIYSGSDIPVLMGADTHEGAYFSSAIAAIPNGMETLERDFDDLLPILIYFHSRFAEVDIPRKVQALKDYYFSGDNFSWKRHMHEITALLTDHAFGIGQLRFLRRRMMASDSADTFLYKFNYRGETSFSDLMFGNTDVDLGVSHTDDLMYLFPFHKNYMNFRVMNAVDSEMQHKMVHMWTRFVRFGNPSTSSYWQPIGGGFPVDYMQIGECNSKTCKSESRTACSMQHGYYQKEFEFMDKFYGFRDTLFDKANYD